MKGLLNGYGRALTLVFFGLVAFWALVLIILPQLTMLERALTAPKRSLDSSIAFQLERDARTCLSVLGTYESADTSAAETGVGTGGMAVPSMSGMAVPSASGMAVPSASGMAVPSMSGMAVPSASAPVSGNASRPYILQCDRATTHVQMARDADQPVQWLNELYDLPLLAVTDRDPIPDQKDKARQIATLAEGLADRLKAEEARTFPYRFDNFKVLLAARPIPMTPEVRQAEDAKLSKQLFTLMGLRFEQAGEIYERIGLITLTRTLCFAMAATALALALCYPIAYKVALATPPDRALWLFLGLVIPYAIVELMRIYAWTTIIDNNGLLNGLMQSIGLISDPIQFKRFPATIFIVIVYTYVLFMVFPVYNVMATLDRNQVEAARDLGARAWRVHWRIIIPHAKPGIAVGTIATFMLSAGAFSVPRIISRGLQAEWFSQTIYNKFFESENSNIGAAYSFAYTLVCFLLVALFMYLMKTRLKDFARVQ